MTADTPKPAVEPRRPRTRFSLRALLIAIAVVASILVIVNNYVRPKIEHRLAVGRIVNSGGKVWFEDKSQDIGIENPYTAQKLNFWRNVGSIDIRSDAQANVIVEEAYRIPELGNVEFGSGVTDAGVAAICSSNDCLAIEAVSFYECAVTNNGVSKLMKLPKLRVVMFNACPVNAAAITELRTIPRLQMLRFVEDQLHRNVYRLDEACFSEIGQLTQLESLSFGALNVSDNSARKLHTLKQLKELSFFQGFISNAAISELRSALPNTEINIY